MGLIKIFKRLIEIKEVQLEIEKEDNRTLNSILNELIKLNKKKR